MEDSQLTSWMSEGAYFTSLAWGHLIHNFFYRGATPETVKEAFEILLDDPKVKSIFINIFGGLHCISGSMVSLADYIFGRHHAL